MDGIEIDDCGGDGHVIMDSGAFVSIDGTLPLDRPLREVAVASW